MDLDLDLAPAWETACKLNDRSQGVLDPWTMAAVIEHVDDASYRLT